MARVVCGRVIGEQSRAFIVRVIMRVQFIGVAACLVVFSACFTELQDDACEQDSECFVGERCVGGTCQASGGGDNNTTAGDAGGDASEGDAGEDTSSNSGRSVNVSILGRVTKGNTGVGVPNVKIFTNPPTEEPSTDANGNYVLDVSVRLGQAYTVGVICGNLPCKPNTPEPSVVTFDEDDVRTVNFQLEFDCFDEELFCDGADDDCDGVVDDGVQNGCNGCGRIQQTVGGACGVCGSGTWSCETRDSVVCTLGNVATDPLVLDEGEACQPANNECGVGLCEAGVCAEPADGCP